MEIDSNQLTTNTTVGADINAEEPPTLSREDYGIGWISALPIESAAALLMLDDEHTEITVVDGDSNTYVLGRIGPHNVAMACMNEAGGLSANITATNLMRSFPNVRYVLMVGIGGGIPSAKYQVRLGDVVVSEPTGQSPGVVQTDFGRWEDDGFKITGSLNRPAVGLIRAMGAMKREQLLNRSMIHSFIKHSPNIPDDDEMWEYQGRENDSIYKLDSKPRKSGTCNRCKKETRVNVHPDPRVHYGIIASGNQVIKNREQRDKVGEKLGACCIEMEAFGLMSNFPTTIIRGIADYADGYKDDRWHGYASLTAAAYAKELLIRLPAVDRERTPKLDQQIEALNRKVDGIEERLNEHRQDGQKETICRWLSKLQPAVKHEDILKRLIPGTGTSLLTEFRDFWRPKGHSSFLFAYGAPGAGKTQALSVLINYLSQNIQDSPKVGFAYIYLDLNDQNSQTVDNIIGSLTKQLLWQLPNVPPDVSKLWRERYKGLPMETRFKMLQKVSECFDETFLCIDALDENVDPTQLLKYLQPSQLPSVRLVCTGREHVRPVSSTDESQETIHTFQIKAQEPDVRAFIRQQIDNARKLGAMKISQELEEEITQRLLALYDGVFLITVLHTNFILGESANLGLSTATDCRENLKSLQSGLGQAFGTMMQRIRTTDLATKILTWIWLAARPLTIDELLHALAVRGNESNLNEESLYSEETFLKCCLGMVTVDTGTRTVRFFHSSLQDYFTECGSTPWQNFKDGHRNIARTCLTYIQFDPIIGSASLQSEEHIAINVAKTSSCFPFLRYAACQWGHHFRNSGEENSELIGLGRTYISRSSQTRHCSHVQLCKHILAEYPKSSETSLVISLSQWHIIAHFGLESLLSNQKFPLEELNSKDSKFGRAPIIWAAAAGHEAVVASLIELGAEINSEDFQKRTALSHAAANGYENIVKALINVCADINTIDISGGTALHWAALKGQKNVISLLLDNGANMYLEDAYGGTPFTWSIWQRELEITQILLMSYVEPEYRFGIIATGIEDIFKFIIKGDIQVQCIPEVRQHMKARPFGGPENTYDGFEGFSKTLSPDGTSITFTSKINTATRETEEDLPTRATYTKIAFLMDEAEDTKVTPLSYAISIENKSAAELLLGYGADPDAKDIDDRTPLSYAAENGLLEMAELLLERDADPNSRDSNGRTPLSHAVGRNMSTLKSLMKHMANSILEDASARRQGAKESIAKILLEKGVDPDIPDNRGRTPLSHAAEAGLMGAVDILIQYGVDPDLADNEGRTPLSWATSLDPVTHHLFGSSVEEEMLDSVPGNVAGEPPFLEAAGAKIKNILEALLERGANPNFQDGNGRTPLSYAAQSGFKGSVKVLLKKGADPTKEDRNGMTPLYLAIKRGNDDIVKMILEMCDLDLEPVDFNGSPILSIASYSGCIVAVSRLLQKGADPNRKDRSGSVPLAQAAGNGHLEVARLLLENGAQPDEENDNGATALSRAASSGHNNIVKLLINKGANPNHHGKILPPLYGAVLCGCTLETRTLIESGADPNYRGTLLEQTPVFAAIYNDQIMTLKTLLELGADPNSKDSNGITPLLYACFKIGSDKGDINIINVLLEYGADIHYVSEHRISTISAALRSERQSEIIAVLFKNGLDIALWSAKVGYEIVVNHDELHLVLASFPATDIRDGDGRTALSHAAGAGLAEVTKLFVTSKGVTIDLEDKIGRTPLFYAIDSSSSEVLSYLLEAGASIHHKDHEGLTPVSYATVSGKESIVQQLHEQGSDLKAVDGDGQTLLEGMSPDKGV